MFWRSAGRALRALALLQLQPPARTAPLPPRGPAACYGTSVTSAKIQVNGVYLHYQQTGEGSHAVLLLPGMLVLKDPSDLPTVHGRLSVGLLLCTELSKCLIELLDKMIKCQELKSRKHFLLGSNVFKSSWSGSFFQRILKGMVEKN